MIAASNHWYKCQEGQMPEDFENVIIDDSDRDMPTGTKQVRVRKLGEEARQSFRVVLDSDIGWEWYNDNDWEEWMYSES